jgi:hypothetical protein
MRILWTAAALACLSAPAAEAQPYDGTWNVAIQTKAGSWDFHRKLCGDGHRGQSFWPSECIGYRGPVRECPRLD